MAKKKKLPERYFEIPQLLLGKSPCGVDEKGPHCEKVMENESLEESFGQLRKYISSLLEEEFAVHSKWFQNWLKVKWEEVLATPEWAEKMASLSGFPVDKLGTIQSWKQRARLLFGSIDNAVHEFHANL